MKKLIAILLALMLAVTLFGCKKAGLVENPEDLASGVESELEEIVQEAGGETTEPADEEEKEAAGMVNPMVAYDSLEAINEVVGCKLNHPGAMGVQDKSYYVIADKVAEYVFDLGIGEWTYRAGKTTDDISGIWVDGSTLSQLTEPEVVTVVDNMMYVYWFDGEMQYSLLCTCADAESVDEDLFTGAWEELRAIQ